MSSSPAAIPSSAAAAHGSISSQASGAPSPPCFGASSRDGVRHDAVHSHAAEQQRQPREQAEKEPQANSQGYVEDRFEPRTMLGSCSAAWSIEQIPQNDRPARPQARMTVGSRMTFNPLPIKWGPAASLLRASDELLQRCACCEQRKLQDPVCLPHISGRISTSSNLIFRCKWLRSILRSSAVREMFQ